MFNKTPASKYSHPEHLEQLHRTLLSAFPPSSSIYTQSAELEYQSLRDSPARSNASTSATADASRRVNWFVLPELVRETSTSSPAAKAALVCFFEPALRTFVHLHAGTLQQFQPKYTAMLGKLQRSLFELETKPFPKGLSEKEWFRYAAKQWDDVCRSQLVFDESRRLIRPEATKPAARR